jgi:hypothetical protein
MYNLIMQNRKLTLPIAFVNQFIFDENCEAWIHDQIFRDVHFTF